MHQTESFKRCLIAIALAMAMLTWSTAGDAQLGGLLPPPTTGTASTVVGDAHAARASVLGTLGTATTTAVADTRTPSGDNDASDDPHVTGSVPSTLNSQ